MRLLCVGQTSRSADLVEIPAGEVPLQRVAAVLKKAGVKLQTCFFFQDTELEGGARLSELVSRALEDGERNADDECGPDIASSPLVGLECQNTLDSTRSLASESTAASLACLRASIPRGPVVWRVLGSQNTQGIAVRMGASLKSDQLAERLAAGSLVEGLRLDGVRLEYRKLSGDGPQTGWISTAVHGKELATTSLGYLNYLNASVGVQDPPVALLFPGESAQHNTMLAFKSLERLPEVRMLLEQAHRILGFDVNDRCLLLPGWLLAKTHHSQPLLFVASMAALLVLRSRKPEKVFGAGAVVGFGMGYYTALCAAGVLPFEDMLHLLRVRGEEMEEAGARGNFMTLSVIGMSRSEVQGLCEQVNATAGAHRCAIAHYYDVSSIGVVGPEDSLFRLKEMAMDAGAYGVMCNPSAIASESYLMEPALPMLEAALAKALPKMKSPSCLVFTTTGAATFTPGCNVLDIVADLKAHLTVPVDWDKTIKAMAASGFREFYEVGPSSHLKRMLYWIDPSLECHAAEAVPEGTASRRAALAEFEEQRRKSLRADIEPHFHKQHPGVGALG